MKFTSCTVGLVATIVSCLGPNTWRPKKMMAVAKGTNSHLINKKKTKRGAELMEMLKKRKIAQNIVDDEALEEGKDIKPPDAGILGRIPERQLQVPCTSYVDCVDGKVNGTTTPCSSASACNGTCCVGTYACFGTTAKICMDGSCNGVAACGNANLGYIIDSCHDYQACAYAGNYGGSVMSVSGSCQGNYSCSEISSAGTIGEITDSCNGLDACSGAANGASLSEIADSCNEDDACKGIASDGSIGGIFDSCNAYQACERFGDMETVYGALINCCNTDSECKETSALALPCLESLISSHSFAGCEVNHSNAADVELMCTFDSTMGLPATAEIKVGTCADNGGFAMPATSPQTTDSTVVATLNITSEISAADKNSGSFILDFCTRSDIFATNSTSLVSFAAEKFDVEISFTYNNEAEFEIAEIDLVPFESTVAQTTFTRTVGVTASLGDCESTSAPTEYAIGSILTICVEVTDPDAIMDRVFNVTIADPPDTILDKDGNPDFLTSVEGIPGAAANISTMMLTSFFDTGDSFITLNGLARVQFTSRRALIEGRALQEEATEEFTLKIPVKKADEPNFTEEAENGATIFGVGISFMMGLFAYVLA